MTPEDPPAVRIGRLAASLQEHFDRLAPWLELGEPSWSTRPADDSWSVAEILEHVVLCQRYLLLLIDKIAERSRRRLAAGAVLPAEPGDPTPLEALAARSFSWRHPEHMAPSGRVSRGALAAELSLQRGRCLDHLRRMPDGEGSLHAIRMSVVGRKLDLYQYLRLLDLHLARHLAQLDRTLSAVSPRCERPATPGPGAPGP